MPTLPTRRPRRAPKPLSKAALGRLVRVVGCPEVGYGVEVNGLLGTDELQTKNRALAHALCSAVRGFVHAMPPARQRRAFDPHCVQLAEQGHQP